MITLPQAISDTDTTIAVTPDVLLPQDNGVLQIEAEQITYSTLYMGTLYGCTRGANSTTPAAHDAGTSVTIANFFQSPPLPGVVFPLLAPDGDVSTPQYVFSSAPTSGFYFDGALRYTLGGVDLFDLGSPGVTLQSGQFFAPTPTTAAAPAYSFFGDTATGFRLYESVPHVLAFSSNGTDICYIQPEGIVLAVSGSNPAFSLGFTTDGSIGLYNSTSGYLNVVAGTNLQFEIGTTVTAEIDNDATAGNTRFLLWDVDSNSLQRVSVGVADSGGTGFKVLRIPN